MNFAKHSLKRWFIYGIVASLLASAGMGILVIIQGSFDEIDWKILTTTLIIGIFSITSLASLRTLESESAPERSFSKISVLMSMAAFVLVAGLIWMDWQDSSEVLWKAAWTLTVLAISSAHVCLLLPLIKRSKNLRTIIISTVAFIAIVAGLILYLVLRNWDDNEPGDLYYRALGVFAILDVLGTIVAPIMAKFLTPTAGAGKPAPASHSISPNSKSSSKT